MTELNLLQNKMNGISKRIDWEVWKALDECAKMLQNDGNKQAVTAYLAMAVHFYGKERIAACIQNYGFERLKKYIKFEK